MSQIPRASLLYPKSLFKGVRGLPNGITALSFQQSENAPVDLVLTSLTLGTGILQGSCTFSDHHQQHRHHHVVTAVPHDNLLHTYDTSKGDSKRVLIKRAALWPVVWLTW